MIYIDHDITEEQLFCIPRTGIDVRAELSAEMTLRSTLECRDILTATVRIGRCSRQYLYVYLTLPEGVQVGEYEYSLVQSEGVISSGIIRVGNYIQAQQGGSGAITFRQGQ